MFGGKTALAIAIENCAGLERPLLVLGCDAPRVRRAVPRAAQLYGIVAGGGPDQLAAARAKTNSCGCRFLIYPVDHPLLKRKTIQQFVRAFRTREESQEIVIPRHEVLRHPPSYRKLRREFFKSKTARDVIYRLPSRVRVIEVQTAPFSRISIRRSPTAVSSKIQDEKRMNTARALF